MVICLERGADVHMTQLMPLPLAVLASVKSRLVLPVWYRLTRVVQDKRPSNGCVHVYVFRVILCVIALQAAFEMIRFQLRHGNDLLAVDCLRKCDVWPLSLLFALRQFNNSNSNKVYSAPVFSI